MLETVIAFLRDKSGAVSSDWVVLSAAVLVLGVAVVASVGQGTASLGPAISAEIIRAMN